MRKRKDANHAPMVKAYKQLGFTVMDISEAGYRREADIPDLIVGLAGVTDLVEIKVSGGKMRKSQDERAMTWKGRPILTVTSFEEAEAHRESIIRG